MKVVLQTPKGRVETDIPSGTSYLVIDLTPTEELESEVDLSVYATTVPETPQAVEDDYTTLLLGTYVDCTPRMQVPCSYIPE